MEFRALGPLSVWRDGEQVDLGPRKQQAVLALLMMHANQSLSVDRIIEEIWGDDGDGKTNALQVYVSRLRSALEPDRQRGDSSILETRGTSYRLNVDPERFDVSRFEHAAAEGRALLPTDPDRAAAELAAALDSWNGTAFEDFAYEEWAQAECRRLTETRLQAYEDRLEADLARGLSGELVSEIEHLRDRHPLRERLVGQHALALYRAGRPADALRAVDRFRRHVGEELGIDPSPQLLRLEEQILLHDDSIQPRRPAEDSPRAPKSEAANPFKGLRPFGPSDAGSFFGRDALVAEILRSLGGGQRLVALVGASGSGKSSVIRAGLIPALAKGAIDGSDDWLVATMMPGAHPFAELEGALLRSTINGPESLSEQLRDDDTGLLRAALRLLPDEGSRLLLVIDQFEELFTLVDDEAERERFLSNLVTAIDDPYDRIAVVVSLRADFYAQPLAHPAFGARLGAGVVNVTELTAEELEAAALKPAEQVGVSFEPALLGQLISDVGSQPGALPLFQYALTELFDRRVGDTLMISTYRSMGGVEGALQRRATELYERLDTDEQEAARQLFLRLVSVGEHDRRSRRRVEAREVLSLDVDVVAMHDVIEQLGDHRLLSFDSDRLTGAPTVEVAHEALLTAWPILEAWVDDSRHDLRRHAALAMAEREWRLAGEHDDYLLPAARLAEYERWSDTSLIALNLDERQFLEASASHVEAAQAAEQQRLQDEARSRRRLWTLVGALAGTLAVAALVLFGVFGTGDDPTVTFFGDRTDEGWNANIGTGLDRAERELDMQLVDVQWVVDPASEFRLLVESEPEIVVTDGLVPALDPSVFTDFPDVRFGVVDEPVRAPNVTWAAFANEEGAFLAGAAAAMKTETGIVGFVGGDQIQVIEQFRAGFEAGVRAVDPEVTVLAVFIDQVDDINWAGFSEPQLGKARADALYQRDADVVFAAAGNSGFGVFEAAAERSATTGRQLWAIGVDNDQWFDVGPDQQPHILTSAIKRGDVAAYRLAEHMLADGPTGEAFRLGIAEDGFDYSKQGDGLTPAMTARLDEIVADITAGRIDVPTIPTGAILTVDVAGNEVDRSVLEEQAFGATPVGVDGLTQHATIDPGTYELGSLGTPVTVTIEGDWWVQPNIAGHTTFSHPDSLRPGDRDVVLLRPTSLADPTQPAAPIEVQVPAPLDDIEDWLDSVVDGIVASEPQQVEIGGRSAVYFEAEITDDEVCGTSGYCAGFIINTIFDDGVSGWSFEPGFHHRVWWVDGGDHEPLVIIAGTPSDTRDFQATADVLLATLQIGQSQPHPVPNPGT